MKHETVDRDTTGSIDFLSRIVGVERARDSRRLLFMLFATAAAESSERAFRRRTGRTRSPR